MPRKPPNKPRPILDAPLRIGEIVHYVEPDGTEQGIHRPAIVSPNYEGTETGLTVLHPQRNYFVYLKMHGKEITPRDEEKKQIKTWHRMEEA